MPKDLESMRTYLKGVRDYALTKCVKPAFEVRDSFKKLLPLYNGPYVVQDGVSDYFEVCSAYLFFDKMIKDFLINNHNKVVHYTVLAPLLNVDWEVLEPLIHKLDIPDELDKFALVYALEELRDEDRVRRLIKGRLEYIFESIKFDNLGDREEENLPKMWRD